MSLRLNRAGLLLVLFLAGDGWALGLGEIRLNSALNEPLRAEIRLVSATPEELESLRVALASAATFERYGLDRPVFLTRLDFSVRPSGSGGIVRVTSNEPVTEPFVTFLVEASWASGRILREYTLLLDPPTFAPPTAAQAPAAVTAPARPQQADRGSIERPASAADGAPFATASGGDVRVQRGDTLWQIAERVRPDNRLSINQVMVAIYEANPAAFAGNINHLSAGATLRVPGADEIFRINRGDALAEVRRQNAAWGGAAVAQRPQPSLTLVPPDGDQPQYQGGARPGGETAADADAAARIRALEARIEEQQSLLEVRDNELAALRAELARLREAGAAAAAAAPDADERLPAEPADALDQVFAEDEPAAAEAEVAAEPEPAAAPAATPERAAPRVVTTPSEPGLADRVLGILTGFWGILGGVLLLVIGILLWLAKRAAGTGDEESTGVWETLDEDEDMDSESRASTERLRALARDDDSAIVVVEQETSPAHNRRAGDTRELPAVDSAADTGLRPALEDTLEGEGTVNLDQSDPIAEADFHMAYGLYDQAAELVNGALAEEPQRVDLLAKLCEIYFVWGNRDAFLEAAGRLHATAGEASPEWNKIVIMGRQIAPEDALFSGASAAAGSDAVDLGFGEGDGEAALDMDFGESVAAQSGDSDIIDFSGEEMPANDDVLDFSFDDDAGDDTDGGGSTVTREIPGRADDATVESPTMESAAFGDQTVESPTLEQPLDSLESTSEMPSLTEAGDDATRISPDSTAEIDLDDLGLDLEALAQAGLEDVDDAGYSDLDATRESTAGGADELEATGRNFLEDLPEDEASATSILPAVDAADGNDATSEMPALEDATGKNPAVIALDEHRNTDVDVDALRDATGQTEVLAEDAGVMADDAETMLAPIDFDALDDDTSALGDGEVDFDFAGTEALPEDAFPGGSGGDKAAGSAGGELDLDLDDLTRALRESQGDTVDQPRDEPTLEQPRAGDDEVLDLDLGELGGEEDEDYTATQALTPKDISDDLHNARTMTEVGTKLDLARAYVDMGDPDGARSILEEVLDEGDEGQRQQAQRLIDTLPA